MRKRNAFFVQGNPKGLKLEKVNLGEKFARFADYWNPRVVGELNGQQVKLVKFQGEFVWHSHADEDELFLVIAGSFDMELRDPTQGDRTISLNAGEFFIVPRGVEHRPVAPQEVSVLLFEPAAILHTGGVPDPRARETWERI